MFTIPQEVIDQIMAFTVEFANHTKMLSQIEIQMRIYNESNVQSINNSKILIDKFQTCIESIDRLQQTIQLLNEPDTPTNNES